MTKAAGASTAKLYIYYQTASPVPTPDFDHDLDNATSSRKQIDDTDQPAFAGELTITFWGAPSVGVDGDCDNNKMVDDTIDEVGATTPADCPEVGGGMDNNDDTDNTDVAESRSKLVVITEAMTSGTSILGGIEKEHPLSGTTENEVTIYAVVQDAAMNDLLDQEVMFEIVEQQPSLIGSASLTTKPKAAVATSSQEGIDGIDPGDAVAMRAISSLPTTSAYRIKVKVTAGGTNLGTVVLARAGKLDMVSAEACATVMDQETDIMNDGCMSDYNPQMVYGPSTDDIPSKFSIYAMATDSLGSMVTAEIMVKPATATTWWDALDCPMMNDAVTPMEGEPAVGPDDMTSPYCKMYAGLSAEAKPVVMRAFGEAYGDATKAFDITTGGKTLTESTVMLMVKENAPQGKYLLDVVATTGSGAQMITESDQVMVTVSGPLSQYGIEGPSRIQPGQVITYTVHARDELGNPAYYVAGQIKMASVFVDANPATIQVRLLDLGNQMVDFTSGSKATFRLRVPPGTGRGSLTITVSDRNQDVKDAFADVRIGANRAPMAGAAVADQMVTVGDMVTAQSAITDPDGDMLSYSVMSSDDMIATAMVDEMGMVTITAVGEGSATITVTATDPDGASATQDIMVTVEMTPEPNQAPMAVGMLDAVMLTMGDAPAMVDVSGAFSDADMDDADLHGRCLTTRWTTPPSPCDRQHGNHHRQ